MHTLHMHINTPEYMHVCTHIPAHIHTHMSMTRPSMKTQMVTTQKSFMFLGIKLFCAMGNYTNLLKSAPTDKFASNEVIFVQNLVYEQY